MQNLTRVALVGLLIAPLAFAGRPAPSTTSTPTSVIITLIPSGGDDTAQIMAALNTIAARGSGEIDLAPGNYSAGCIAESVPGLILRGYGHRVQGPGDAGMTTGAVIHSTCPGYSWTRTAPLTGSNEYRGALIEGVTFVGNGTASGALLLQSSYNTVREVSAIGYTAPGARCFYVLAPSWTGGAAQENFFVDDGAQNCSIGLESASCDQSEVRGFITLKTAAGGIHGQGYGLVIRDASRVSGGKLEGNATGALFASHFAQLDGTGFEDNTLDVDLDRGTTGEQSLTQNRVSGGMGTVRIGPWNFGDMVLGGGYPRVLTDVPNPQGIAKGTFAFGAWNA